jgi:two-component sensor histidine kinase
MQRLGVSLRKARIRDGRSERRPPSVYLRLARRRGRHLRLRLLRAFDPVGHRLMLLFALLALPPTLVGIVEALNAYDEQNERARQSARQFAILASTFERHLIENSEYLLTSLAKEPAVLAAGRPEGVGRQCGDLLSHAIKPYPVYGSLILFDLKGVALCSNDPAYVTVNVAGRDWFREVVATDRTQLSGYVIAQGPEVPAVILGHPVHDAGGGALKAVLALSIELDWLQPVERLLGLPSGGAAYLLDRDAAVLTGLEVPQGFGDRGLPDPQTLAAITTRDLFSFAADGRDGIARIYAVTPLEQGQLFILVGMPKSGTLGWIQRELVVQMIGFAALWLAGLLAAWIGTRALVTRWTGQLATTAKAMSKGNLAARADLEGAPAELRLLGDTLGDMAKRLEARQTELHEALAQKDVLLREIHHRIKNNLQTVTSLLNLHSKGIRSEGAQQALQQIRMRVQALALVHRHLYESETMRDVELRSFLGDLCQLLQDGSGTSRWRVRLGLEIANLRMPVERATPLALLVTELVTNSFKHAFPDNRYGTITVKLLTAEDGMAVLSVADDGVGLPESAGSDPADMAAKGLGLGAKITQAFARQLGGELGISGPPGTTVTLAFPIDASAAKQLSASIETSESQDSGEEMKVPPIEAPPAT